MKILKILLLCICCILSYPEYSFAQKKGKLEYDQVDKFERSVRQRCTKDSRICHGGRFDQITFRIKSNSAIDLSNPVYELCVNYWGYTSSTINKGNTLEILLRDNSTITLYAKEDSHGAIGNIGGTITNARYAISEQDIYKMAMKGIQYVRYQNSIGRIECPIKEKRSKDLQKKILPILP